MPLGSTLVSSSLARVFSNAETALDISAHDPSIGFIHTNKHIYEAVIVANVERDLWSRAGPRKWP
jgi:hypothetical protein